MKRAEDCEMHFGGKEECCGTCVSFFGFRIAITIIAGIMIGLAGMLVVEDPPASILLNEQNNMTGNSEVLLQKIDHVEDLVIELKSDVLTVKKQFAIKNNH